MARISRSSSQYQQQFSKPLRVLEMSWYPTKINKMLDHVVSCSHKIRLYALFTKLSGFMGRGRPILALGQEAIEKFQESQKQKTSMGNYVNIIFKKMITVCPWSHCLLSSIQQDFILSYKKKGHNKERADLCKIHTAWSFSVSSRRLLRHLAAASLFLSLLILRFSSSSGDNCR